MNADSRRYILLDQLIKSKTTENTENTESRQRGWFFVCKCIFRHGFTRISGCIGVELHATVGHHWFLFLFLYISQRARGYNTYNPPKSLNSPVHPRRQRGLVLVWLCGRRGAGYVHGYLIAGWRCGSYIKN